MGSIPICTGDAEEVHDSDGGRGFYGAGAADLYRRQAAAARGWAQWVPILLCGLGLFVSGCRKEMWVQPKYKPLDMSEFFADTMSARPLVEGTVAQGDVHTNESFYTGLVGTNLVEEFPLPITRELLERGQERYNIYCALCHGPGGDGDGMIVKRGFPAPPSYHIDRLRRAPVGHFFRVMTKGYGIMYPYATRVSAEDRWKIAAYIRALQLSRHAPLEEAPPKAREELELSKP